MSKQKSMSANERREHIHRQHQAVIALWEDDKYRRFTCHACGCMRVIPLEGLVSIGGTESGMKIADCYTGGCYKCGRPILELQQFERMYCLDLHIELPADQKKKKFDKKSQPSLDFNAHEPIKCFVKEK